ncbi:hypothetical protein HYC85_001073 [Camellia sinensis]|uniref:Uncharacterized protein n=1 Tax=Camellia sinensis TaxID=4442 RepID=A0A7J7I630_CAMSI|nr:hypothetical protein HYC85_001073 [Camellia sinensis]
MKKENHFIKHYFIVALLISEVVDESQSNTSKSGEFQNAFIDHVFHTGTHYAAIKSICTSSLIGDGGTHPSLDTIHLKQLIRATTNRSHCLNRLLELINAAFYVLYAGLYGSCISGSETIMLSEL